MSASATPSLPERLPPAAFDQRVLLRGVPWAQYEALVSLRGESAVPRMTYLDGDLELMSPSIDHEQIKTTLARLVEAWADMLDLDLQGFGSWTIRAESKRRGAEADECYSLGGPDKPERPDLAIEVNWTSGGLNKLDVWHGLGVREVWMWQDDRIDVFVLHGEAYVASEGSELLPQMDLVLLARLARLRQREALRELRERALRPP